MASDALWVVSFKCVVKGYQDCSFDVKEDENFDFLKNIGEKGRTFRIVNERGQLGHLQRELAQARRQGGALSARAPPPTSPKRSAQKLLIRQNRKEKGKEKRKGKKERM